MGVYFYHVITDLIITIKGKKPSLSDASSHPLCLLTIPFPFTTSTELPVQIGQIVHQPQAGGLVVS